jgi:TfoX/Sxy family transcriptional regulator of competence genes
LTASRAITKGRNMASDQNFIDFLVDQMGEAGSISQRKMFGDYALYCDGKVVALVCDNQLFVKPTAGGRAYIGAVVEAPPYPGAKPYFLIEDAFEDRDWISGLIKITALELPLPKPKRGKAKTIRSDRP